MNDSISRSPKIGIIGTGYRGKNLVRNYAQLGVLAAICDKNQALFSHFKKEHPDGNAYPPLNDIPSQSDIQGTAVATPAETYFAIAREALLAGKHVYVEKPLVLVERDAQGLILIAKSKNLILMVGHLLQDHPATQHLKIMIHEGELGGINDMDSHRLNLQKIPREENILWSFAPRDVSMILSIAGEDPDHVMSTGGSYLHQRIADVTTTHLEFPSGLRAHIFVSWLHPYKEQKLVVVGDQTMAVFDDTQSWADKLHLYSHRIRWGNNLPVTGKGNAERVQVAEAEPLFGECKQFPDVIQPGKNPPTDGREGLRILRILCASQASFHSNGARIQTKETIHPINKASRGPTIHDTAIFDHGVSTRDDSKIWNFPHIPKASSIGKGCHSGKTSSSVPMWPLETDARYKRMFPYNRRYA